MPPNARGASIVYCSKTSGSSDSSAARAPPEDSPGDVLSLSRVSLAATDPIFGLHAIELWSYEESTGKLLNVDLASRDEEAGLRRGGGGLLLKRRTRESDPANDGACRVEARIAFDRLTDASREDFLPPVPTNPGVGLPGVLWAGGSSAASGPGARLAHSLSGRQNVGARFAHSLSGRQNVGGGEAVAWRDVAALADDPDQPYDERLQTFATAGFRLAAGVQFDINGYRGIVIFYGNPHADPNKLRHPSNSEFINISAQLIGCTAAIQGPMRRVSAFREEVRYQNWHRVKVKTMMVVRLGGTLRQPAKDPAEAVNGDKAQRRSAISQFIDTSYREGIGMMKLLGQVKEGLQSRSMRWCKKVQGGSAGIPPSFSFRQCLWTFVGVMMTHAILSRINLLVEMESDGELSLILAPLGALTTLQYCLTAAPASQPRNAFFAQVFAVTVAILLSYIPNVEPWFRSALAPAIVIPCMAKLGIVHPPAGAAAVVFSSGAYRWEHFGIFLSGVAISIVTAVCINNMSDKRQYPTSWYLFTKAKSNLSSSK